MRVGLLTVSDRAHDGQYEDLTGPAVAGAVLNWCPDAIITVRLVPDDAIQITAVLTRWCDEDALDLIVTNGGTGLTKRDITPEATYAVIDRAIPGLAELMRAESVKKTPMAAISRQVVGQRNATLIVNVPGSVKAALECFEAVMPVLAHAIETIHL